MYTNFTINHENERKNFHVTFLFAYYVFFQRIKSDSSYKAGLYHLTTWQKNDWHCQNER